MLKTRVKDKRGAISMTEVAVPKEELSPGPTGYRVQVVDYDASLNKLYQPQTKGLDGDPFRGRSGRGLLNDPRFHCQNVYAIVMRTLARFEFSLGRRVSWSF